MRRKMLAGALALLLLLALAACGGGALSTASADTAASTSEMAPMEMEYGGSGYDSAAVAQDSAAYAEKMIHTATLELETTGFDEAVSGLARLTEELGGYFESSSIGSRGTGYRWADYTVRIPAERYQEFLDQAGDLCHETWRNTSQDNISETYYDTEGRLKTQQIKLERLQALLAQAEAMEDIITIESAISETEQAIESLSGTLRHYDGLVDYATVYISLSEVYKLSNVEEVPDGFGSRLGAAFSAGLSGFVDGLENLAVALAYGWLWILLLAAVVIAAVKILRRRRRAAQPAPEKRDGQERS